MASVSFSLTRGTDIDTLTNGSQTVTEGTSAPGAGDLEIRMDLTKNITKRELKKLLDVIWRYAVNPATGSTTIPF